MPATLIGCARDLLNAKGWIEGAFAYWGNDGSQDTPLGRKGLDVMREALREVLCCRTARCRATRSTGVTPTPSDQGSNPYPRLPAISSPCCCTRGAGTGKTILAVEKARRLAAEGLRTLLACYNRPLADHLATVCDAVPNLDVMSFHQLCHQHVVRANRLSGRDLVAEAKVTYPGKNLYDVQLPNALAYALEIIPDRYDAIVCDEGQDFREEFWLPLELLLADYENSPLYIFFDDNQNIYARAGTLPIRDEPFSRRSTVATPRRFIVAVYKYYKGLPVSPSDIPGDEIQWDAAAGRDQQATKITARIVDLIARQGVAPGDITVLIADAWHKAEYYSVLMRLPLPMPANWLEEGVRGEHTVLMDTIQRFKGLESPIVIIWGLDTLDLSRHHECSTWA